jgi:glycosyltransferase involved in cell wall biosynthesis
VRRAYRIADRIVALGSLERAWIADNFPAARGRLASYVVAPPPEDRRRLAEVRNERQSPGRGRRFLWLGRWAPHKGTERLLEWANGHLVANPQDRLTIAGCGEVPSRDVSRLSAFGDRVRWLARFRRAQLPELLGQHDCGLFTSVVEGWGLSLNEMLESGMTVYATDAGGATELRPYFPRQLQQFPPTLEKRVEPALDDIEKSGYLARWNWDRIAEDYQGELVAGRADLGQAS